MVIRHESNRISICCPPLILRVQLNLINFCRTLPALADKESFLKRQSLSIPQKAVLYSTCFSDLSFILPSGRDFFTSRCLATDTSGRRLVSRNRLLTSLAAPDVVCSIRP